MSIIYKSGGCILIDHCQYISKLFQNTTSCEEMHSYTFLTKLFSIKSNRKNVKNSRKRKSDCDIGLEETKMVKEMYYNFIKDIPSEIKSEYFNKYNLMDTSDLRDLTVKLFESTIFELTGTSGGNTSDIPMKCKVKDNYFLIPPKSSFYCGCVKEHCSVLTHNKYQIIIADPPWWNKYIRRLKGANEKLSYSMMYNEDIAAIPVKDLMSENCLVAVWCTNAPSNITAVKDLIFPAWGVEYLTTWYWLKMNIDCEPLCEFGTGSQKQPYERLMLGRVGNVKDVPRDRVFVSIPSALHSHKPPLLDLLTPYVQCDDPEILELFARYLLPNTTSVGYEPLKWQHISLYEATN